MSPAWWILEHELPGRSRFRMVISRPQPDRLAIEASVHSVAGVREATFRPATRSLLVLHDGRESTMDELRLVLAQDPATLPPVPAKAGAIGFDLQARALRSELMSYAVVSVLSAALPPVPRVALKLLRTLSSARRPHRLPQADWRSARADAHR